MVRERMWMKEASVSDLEEEVNPSSTEVEDRNTRTHYNRCMSKCKCEKAYNTSTREEFGLRLGRMKQQERRNAVSAMLFVATKAAGTVNEHTKNIYRANGKQDKRDGRKQKTTVYAILGQMVCLAAFSAVMQMSHQADMLLAVTNTEMDTMCTDQLWDHHGVEVCHLTRFCVFSF